MGAHLEIQLGEDRRDEQADQPTEHDADHRLEAGLHNGHALHLPGAQPQQAQGGQALLPAGRTEDGCLGCEVKQRRKNERAGKKG